MQATLLLADAAEAVNGKLYILGGGWSLTGPEPTPSAVAVQIKVPWKAGSQRHDFRLELLDANGAPVTGPEDKPIAIGGGFELGPGPPGLKGSMLDVPLAINVGPLQLQADQAYEWRLSIDGETRGDWNVEFRTRAKAEGPKGPRRAS